MRLLLIRDSSPAFHTRIVVGEALLGLTIDDYSICNFLKPAISCGLSIRQLERCLKLHPVEDVMSVCVLSQFNILACLAQPLNI